MSDDASTPGPVRRKVPPELDRKRIDRVLGVLFPERGRAAWTRAVRRGEVRIDGRAITRTNASVSRGQRIEVNLGAEPPGQNRSSAPKRVPDPRIVHEDQHCVVLDKPAGWLTHPADRAEGPDLVRFCADRFGPLPLPDDRAYERAGVVHRLDRGTSGLIVMARTDAALEDLRDQFRRRTVDKLYLALVHGAPEEERLEVGLPLRPSRRQRDLQLTGDHPEAKAARTAFELVERLGVLSLMACRPSTGRRHQIRAHLAAVGVPVFADPLYRAPAEERERARALGLRLPRGRHALHAHGLELELPGGAGRRRFRSELADDLREVVEAARTRR